MIDYIEFEFSQTEHVIIKCARPLVAVTSIWHGDEEGFRTPPPKKKEPLQKCGRQKGDVKQVPY